MLQKNGLEKKSETQAARFNSRQRRESVPKTRKLQEFHSFPPLSPKVRACMGWFRARSTSDFTAPPGWVPFLWLERKDHEKHSLPFSLPHKHCWTGYSEVRKTRQRPTSSSPAFQHRRTSAESKRGQVGEQCGALAGEVPAVRESPRDIWLFYCQLSHSPIPPGSSESHTARHQVFGAYSNRNPMRWQPLTPHFRAIETETQRHSVTI